MESHRSHPSLQHLDIPPERNILVVNMAHSLGKIEGTP
jgi:hypothetical protein